jgi:hypothetical protein
MMESSSSDDKMKIPDEGHIELQISPEQGNAMRADMRAEHVDAIEDELNEVELESWDSVKSIYHAALLDYYLVLVAKTPSRAPAVVMAVVEMERKHIRKGSISHPFSEFFAIDINTYVWLSRAYRVLLFFAALFSQIILPIAFLNQVCLILLAWHATLTNLSSLPVFLSGLLRRALTTTSTPLSALKTAPQMSTRRSLKVSWAALLSSALPWRTGRACASPPCSSAAAPQVT